MLKLAKLGVVALLTLLVSGCAVHVPADPHGTLERVTNGVMHVGVTENPPWVEWVETGTPAGTEITLIEGLADELGAEIRWRGGSEAELMDALDRGELDVVLGGFLDDTPWLERGALTRPYTEIETTEGIDKHVMIVRMGENGFLVALETYLHEAMAS